MVLAAVVLACSGCSTTTNTKIDPGVVDTTAVVLRGAARDGAVIAIQNNPETKQYFAIAASTLETFITGKDYTPGAFQAALTSIKSSEIQNPYVQIGIGTVVDLYQLYFSQYAKNALQSNDVAKAFVVAIQDGFNQALGNPVTVAHYMPGSALKASPGSATKVLPRPIK